MKQNKLMKHLKRAISKYESRPVLQCAHYGTDGSIVVTDSHRLIKIDNFHTHEESFNLNLLTMELNGDNYPDTNNIIPKIEDMPTKLTVSLGALKRALLSLKTNTGDFINIDMFDGYITLSNPSDKNESIDFEVKLNVAIEGDKYPIAFNTGYLIEAVEFLLDAKDRYAVDNVTIHMTSPDRPAVLKIEDQKYTYLVTPVITYK